MPPVTSTASLEIDSGDDEPPIVPRTDQFKLRPNGRGRGKGRGGRGRGKLQVETIQESDDEKYEQEEEQQEEKREDRSKPVKRKVACKAKAKAKSKASCKAKATSKPKTKRTKKTKHATDDNGTDEHMEPPAEDQEPKIVWELITKSNNKFPWGQDGQLGQAMDLDTAQHSLEPAGSNDVGSEGSGSADEAAPSVALSEPDVAAPSVDPEEPTVSEETKAKRKRARPGESIHGKSFARRACPKTSPAKDKWECIRVTFGEEVQPYLDFQGLAWSAFEAGFLEQWAVHIICSISGLNMHM